MNKLYSVAVASTLLFATALRADEVRLKDGRVLVGSVREVGKMREIETRDGIVRVAASEIDKVTPEAELRKELARLEQSTPDTPFSHLQLALQAFAWDLDAELWRHLDAAVQVPRDAAHQGLRSRIDDFLAQLEPELLPRKYRSADVRVRVHELLQRLPKKAGDGRLAATQELLVREVNADTELKAEARRNHEPWRRSCAVEALLRRGTRNNDTFAWRTAILDPSADVRQQSMVLARQYSEPAQVVQYLAPGLLHGNADVRVRTGEAFGELGERAALKLIVMAGPNAAKALADADQGVRAHAAFIQQQAYIRDFDVEVAQASFIADPQIDVLQSGAVIDVTVMDVQIVRTRIVNAWRGALKRIAGSDPGGDPRTWGGWLAELPAAAQDEAGRNG